MNVPSEIFAEGDLLSWLIPSLLGLAGIIYTIWRQSKDGRESEDRKAIWDEIKSLRKEDKDQGEQIAELRGWRHGPPRIARNEDDE